MKKCLQVVLGLCAVWACITLTGCTFPGYAPPEQSAFDGLDPLHATATLAPGVVVEVGEHAPESPAEGGGICDRAAPGHPIDVTVADGTIFQPEEEFTKTWRLVNVGDCPWSEDYAIIWFSGESMGSSRILYLDVPVHPGESIDLSVEMTAPQQNGLYQSNWKMRNAEGMLFGLGPQGDAPFWARITVFDGSTPTAVTDPTSTPIPVIYKQGEVEVADAVPLDVDSGDVGLGDDDDVSLVFKAGQITVIPLGDVKLGLPDIKAGFPPAQNECIQTPLSAEAIVLEDLTEDIYICYQSSQGLPGYLWLKSVGDTAEQPDAAFVTWFVP